MRMCTYNHTRRVRYIANKRYVKFGNTSRKIHTFALTFAGIISVVRCIYECMKASTCRNGSFIKPRCNGNKLIGERRVHLCVHPWSRGSNVLSRRMVNGIAAPTGWQTLTMWIAALSKTLQSLDGWDGHSHPESNFKLVLFEADRSSAKNCQNVGKRHT